MSCFAYGVLFHHDAIGAVHKSCIAVQWAFSPVHLLKFSIPVFSLLLVVGSAAALRWLDPSDGPRAQAQAAFDQHDFPRAVALCQEALRRDPASANSWSDLAEAFYAAGDTPRARQCFARALELGPHILVVWVHDAMFHYRLDEPDAALISSARVLTTVPDYDAILFSYFDRLLPDPQKVLSQIGSNKRATISYFQHFIDSGSISAAETTWTHAFSKNYVDDKLAASYVDFLLHHHLYDNALQSWTDYVGPKRRDYPERNLLYNGNFETKPTGSPFDWRIQPSDRVDTVLDRTNPKDGDWSIHITFHGDDNIPYDNVIQTARVRPGPHHLRAWISTDGITTNEGLRVRVFDPETPARMDYRTSPITGTHDWMLLDEPVTIPSQTNLVSVEICRTPSQKFDNKIAGSAWIDQVSLSPGR